jgi:type III secretory pathway component EscV
MENFLDFLISLVILAIIYFFMLGGSSRKQKTTTPNTTTKDVPLTDDAQKEKMKEEGMSNNIPLSVEVEDREINSFNNDVIDKVDEEQNTLKDVIDVVPPPSDVNDVSAPSLAFTNKTEGGDYSGVQVSIHPLMQDFDLRKAILYSEIVEKKYF